MPISFDSLPTTSEYGLIEKGKYIAKIEAAMMKQPQDVAKPPYLSLTYSLKNAAGENKGKLYDMLFDSDANIVRYKLQRFITALEIPIKGNFELKDLTKIVVGKSMLVDVTKDEKSNPVRNVVDVFTGEIYYSLSEADSSETGGDIDISDPDEEDIELINASDATDAVAKPKAKKTAPAEEY